MKEKTIKFKSITFDEIEGDDGLSHHEYSMDGEDLCWYKNDRIQRVYSGVEVRTKIKELMN